MTTATTGAPKSTFSRIIAAGTHRRVLAFASLVVLSHRVTQLYADVKHDRDLAGDLRLRRTRHRHNACHYYGWHRPVSRDHDDVLRRHY